MWVQAVPLTAALSLTFKPETILGFINWRNRGGAEHMQRVKELRSVRFLYLLIFIQKDISSIFIPNGSVWLLCSLADRLNTQTHTVILYMDTLALNFQIQTKASHTTLLGKVSGRSRLRKVSLLIISRGPVYATFPPSSSHDGFSSSAASC